MSSQVNLRNLCSTSKIACQLQWLFRRQLIIFQQMIHYFSWTYCVILKPQAKLFNFQWERSVHLKKIYYYIVVYPYIRIPCQVDNQRQRFFFICNIFLSHLNDGDYFLIPNLFYHLLIISSGFQLHIIIQMISTCLFKGASRIFQKWAPRYGMNHIKDMREENLRAKAQEMQNLPVIQTTNRVYKPTYTIEFNRQGQVLLYSANTISNQTIYFKYPYILYESFIPLAILNYVLNPLDMVWYWTSYSLYGSLALTIPRIWYWAEFKYYPMKLYLLRGGRVIKVQAQNLNADRFIYWIESYLVKPLTQDKMRFDDRDQADFLNEQGQLKYDLDVEVEEFKFWGVNVNNQQLHFKTYGTVHHPQLFEAVLKGYNVDTTDFTINTADNVRYRQPNHNV